MTIHHGDCLDVMAAMEPESIDAICTDPPYGLEFMGMAWDQFDGRENGTPRPRNEWGDFGSREHARGQDDLHRVTLKKARSLQAFSQRWAEAAYRVAKPSAYLLAFGGTRTVHRMTVALEDAGWIIRDMLVWAYASGFPKSKASLKPAWEPIVMARKPGPLRNLNIEGCRIGVEVMPHLPATSIYGTPMSRSVSGPTTTMDGWDDDASLCASCAVDAENPARPGASATRGSTTPKPAELSLTGAAISGDTNRAGIGCSHGMTPANGGSSSSTAESGRTPTGLFHPDTLSTISTRTSSITGSRTCTCCGGPITPTTTNATRFDTETGPLALTTSESTASVGRWPPNLLITDPIFDGGVEGVVGGGWTQSNDPGITHVQAEGWGHAAERRNTGYAGDSGTYSRFFLVPKADRSDREPVLGGLPLVEATKGVQGLVTIPDPRMDRPQKRLARSNVHPTVKPTELMRHLVRLVTPSGGTVLDPFLGSGTTGLACELEGFPWIGIEKEAEYVAIAEARLNGTQRGLGLAG